MDEYREAICGFNSIFKLLNRSMMKRPSFLLLMASVFLITSCQSKQEKLKEQVNSLIRNQQGSFAVAFKDLTTGEQLLINESESFHAASTMKTPVMIEVFKQASEGKFSLNDSILIINKFKSIVDSSTYSLTIGDDSEADIYKKVGSKTTISDLVYLMITASSNLATNLLIEMVNAEKVTQTMRDLGAKNIQVLRGVEDQKAFDKGLINTVTAYDLMIIFEKIATGKAVNEESSNQMIAILKDQVFNDIIPAKLPKDVVVAHKTGSIKGIHHDSAIVYLPNGKSYVLVVLSKNLRDEKKGIETMANISKVIFEYEDLNRK